jgi:hypothetical protein
MPDPIAVALRVADLFETLGLRYTIGGSLASSLSGEPRSTLDVDMVVAMQGGMSRALLKLGGGSGEILRDVYL